MKIIPDFGLLKKIFLKKTGETWKFWGILFKEKNYCQAKPEKIFLKKLGRP